MSTTYCGSVTMVVTVALAYTFSHGAKVQANQGYVYYGSIGILGKVRLG